MALRDFLRSLFRSTTTASQSIAAPAASDLTHHGQARDVLQESEQPQPGMTGAPTSSNGASSMHLFWKMPPPNPSDPLLEVLVTIEILAMPTNNRLYFWALQASFRQDGKTMGAGHFGLQYHPQYPDGGAINWGGYHGTGSTGSGELPGSPLRLPSALNNPNTGNYPWQAGRQYQYRIRRSDQSQGRWVGSITDTESGVETIVRELSCPGNELSDLMVWTEAFAHCDEPGAKIRWSGFSAVRASGTVVHPRAVRTNYQTLTNGGCLTSNIELIVTQAGDHVVEQQTGTKRLTPGGSDLPL